MFLTSLLLSIFFIFTSFSVMEASLLGCNLLVKGDLGMSFLVRMKYLFCIIGFFGFLLASSIYRLKSYYVNYIANQEGKNCCSSMCNSFGILFGRKNMEKINFVDFNSLFIVHALSSSNDFLQDEKGSDNASTELLNRDSK